MIRNTWFAILLLALTITACKPVTTELTEQQKAEIVDQVDAAANEWWTSWQTMDFEKGMSFISHATEASYVGDESILYGVAAMREDWSNWAAGLQKQDIDFTDSRTIVLAPDIAYTILQYTGIATRVDGSVMPKVAGVETIVWVKRDGEWKILLVHESTLRDAWQARLNGETDQ